MMGKLLKFTGKWKGKGSKPVSAEIQPPKTLKELADRTIKVRLEHTEIIVDDVTQYFLSRVRGDGIAIEKSGDIANYDVEVFRQAMRGAILRFYNINYHFQEVANEIFGHAQKKKENVKEIEDLNPMLKKEVEPEPEPPDNGPMVG